MSLPLMHRILSIVTFHYNEPDVGASYLLQSYFSLQWARRRCCTVHSPKLLFATM